MAELEDDVVMKEREHALTLEDSRRNEKKLDEQVRADYSFSKLLCIYYAPYLRVKILLRDAKNNIRININNVIAHQLRT